MITATVTIKTNHLPGMSGRLTGAVDDVLTKGALDIYAASIPWTPIETGALRGNVTTNKNGVHWHQHYAAHQEMGTVRGITPKLFARTAYERVAPGMIAALQQIEGELV